MSVAIIPLVLILRSPKKQRGTNFFLGAGIFGRAKKWALKTNVHILHTTRNVAFCPLLPKCQFQLSFLICFHQKFLE